MIYLRRWPKRFQVMVSGSNFSFKFDENPEPVIGFYTTRWVDAFDTAGAITKAFTSVKKKLHEKGYGSILSELKLEVEEISEVSFWRERWSKVQGFVFYPQEKESDGHRPPLQ